MPTQHLYVEEVGNKNMKRLKLLKYFIEKVKQRYIYKILKHINPNI